jgi:hypothetical protein
MLLAYRDKIEVERDFYHRKEVTMTNPDVYPVTARFEQQAALLVKDRLHVLDVHDEHAVLQLIKTMKSNIGGIEQALYLDDVILTQQPSNWEVKAYASVCEDVLVAFLIQLTQ